ncbi:unnamed protein product [Camellia sinensis]
MGGKRGRERGILVYRESPFQPDCGRMQLIPQPWVATVSTLEEEQRKFDGVEDHSLSTSQPLDMY